LKNTISQRENFNLEHEKVHGRWKAAFESKHRMRGMKCLQMKMKGVEGGEKHHMQSLIGQKIVSPEGDFTGGISFNTHNTNTSMMVIAISTLAIQRRRDLQPCRLEMISST
jgi:hypothetical protein